ncbi:hypothetical protein BGX27_004709 [Mortierella sp. AM989]|nr:hypothetical protein BGX27_004709 [Mortierella sp. AM989]
MNWTGGKSNERKTQELGSSIGSQIRGRYTPYHVEGLHPTPATALGTVNDKTSRQTCLDMLQSSFDWIGEAYLLRPLAEPSQRASEEEHDECSSNASDEEAEESPAQELKEFTWDKRADNYNNIGKVRSGEEEEEEEEDVAEEEKKEEEAEEEEEEEETLKVPERHIAICRAVQLLRESTAKQHAMMSTLKILDCGTLHEEGKTANYRDGCLPNILTPKEDEALVMLPQIELDAAEEEGLSPVISNVTPEYGRSCNLLSQEWPANQEAARLLELSKTAEKERHDILGSRDQFQNDIEGMPSIGHWPMLFTPVLLPTDPEDITILEPLDALNESPQAHGITLQTNDWSSDCSFPEMIRSEDWCTYDDSEVLDV